jgi:uncharacterized protein YecA (UPF0149 family)
MESDQPEAGATDPTASGAEPPGPAPEEAPAAPTDPAVLVDRLVEAGDWPDPALVGQIVEAGEAALGPLLDFMRTYPTEYQREIALYNGIGILGAIRSTAAIPVLVEIIRRYPEDSGERAAQALGEFGAIGFEPALELVQDPGMKGYARQNAIHAARQAAGSDPILRARLAAALRPILADAMDRTREKDRQAALEPDAEDDEESEGWVLEDLDDEDDLEDMDEEDEIFEEGDLGDESGEARTAASDEAADGGTARDLEPYEEVMFLVGDLAALADPEARGLIKTAFAENLVDTFWIDEKFVEEQYREGGEEASSPRDWLEDYRGRYREHMEALNRPRPPLRPLQQGPRSASYREPPDERPPLQPPETIRNTGPKLGRNDPCWCGSGKKYKKCHLGKEGAR